MQDYEFHTNDLGDAITGSFFREPKAHVVALNTTETFSVTFTVVTTFPALPVDDGPPYAELAVAEIRVFGTAVSDTTEPTDTTTTTIVAMPTLPPELGGTTFAVTWSQWVNGQMVRFGYDIEPDDIDAYEREMERGLVHATFTTADGTKWAMAFGPWREGEYSEDPAVLQEHFFAGEPGQETSEGLLFVATERLSPPLYVYLAMDVGKIAISVEPSSASSAVPEVDLLRELALGVAPGVRQLLEADLIEWNT